MTPTTPPAKHHDTSTHEEAYESIHEASKAWVARWPNHCPHCYGWGFKSYIENHGLPGPGEALTDPCEHCVSHNRCARCQQPGLDEYGGGSCTYCGWDYDDGDPATGL